MPPARSRVQQRSIGIYIVIVSVLAAGAAIYYHLPGMALIWLGLVVAAWMEPPAIMSGSKDASGYPTASNTREEACLARSRFWRSLKFRMIMPNSNWLPGWPVLGAFCFAVIAAAAAWQLPVLLVAGHPSAAVAKALLAHHHPIPKVPFAALRWVDAVAAFIISVQVTASRRANRPEGSDCPGTRINSVPALFKKPIGLAGVALGLLLGGASYWAAHKYLPISGVWAVPNVQYAAITASLLIFGVVISGPWRSVALDRWRFLAATSAAWERNWVAVKHDKPSPRLLDHRVIGVATIEEFESPPSSGAAVFYPLTAKLGPAVGAGSRIAILEMPDTDRKGQPIPGTRHPRRFQVVTWPADDKLDLTDQALSAQPDLAELALRCTVVWALDPLKIERPVLLSSSLITEPGKPAAWMTTWAWPDGPGIEAARALIGPLEAETGSRVLVDSTAADAIYFGALDSPAGDYAQTSGEPFDQALARLKFEDKWSQIWASVMKLSGGRAASQAERTAQMPTMTTRRKVGPAIVDEFSAPTSMGAAGFMLMGPKLLPAIGAGTVVAVLPMPEINRDGQPVPGSRHPINFQVVTWRSSDTPDLTDPDVPIEVAELWINCAVGNALDPMGIGRPTLLAIEPIGDADGHLEDPEDDEDGGSHINLSKSDPDDEPAARGTMAWRTQWQPFGAADLVYLRNNAMEAIAGSAGCEVLIDQRALNSIFFGALTGGTTQWLPGERDPWETVMQNLSNEDKWTFRWDQVYPAGKTNQPTIQPKTHRTTNLPSGVKLERVAFIGRTGMDPTLYKGLESKFATALQAAPFVSITGYPPKGEPAGSRHAMGFYITWSNGPVPANPGDMAFSDGAQWVVAGLVNNAFDAAFGAAKGRRPEVVSSRTLTGEGRPTNPLRTARRVPGRPEASPAADKQIWEVQVRLYGGVTLAEIRGVAQKIRQTLGAPWLRIAPAPSGVTLFFGHLPAEVTLTNPGRDKLRLTALDWQQAFLDSGLSPSQGLLPELTAMTVLPKNTDVQVLDFQCPPGLDPSVVRGSVEKLCTATANEYVEVRAGVGGADTMRLLSSKENPLPKRAAFDFDAIDGMEGIPFATDISGEYVTFNPQVDPHMLIAGSSGSGKSVSLQCFLHGWIRKGGLAAVIDPSKGAADFKFAEPYSTAFAVDVATAAALMKALYAEVVLRKDVNAAAGVGGFRDLENPPRPYLIVIDEFTSLIGASPVPKPSDDPEIEVERQAIIADNGYRSMIGAMAGKIAREARSAGFTLILGTQRLTAAMLDPIPGSSDLRTNLSRMLVGKATTGEMQSALRAPFDAPSLGAVVPKGRALWETSAGAAQAVQGWYANQSALAADLVTRMPAMDPTDRIDITGFMPKAAAVAGITEEVSFLGEMDFSLDDLELDEDEVVDDEEEVVQEEAEAVEEVADTDGDQPAVEEDADAAVVDAVVEHDEESEAAAMDALFSKLAARPAPFDQALNPALSETLLCLDIDGVLSPLGPENNEWVGWLPVAGTTQVSSEMLSAITDLGVSMAWLTTWGDEAPSAFAGLLASDIPVLPRPAESDTWWKIDALLTYLSGHREVRRVAFVDDHLAREDDLGITHAETLGEALDDLGIEHLLLTTDPAAGLTVDELDQLHAWITAPPAPVQHEAKPEPESAVDDASSLAAVEERPLSVPEPAAPPTPAAVADDDGDPFGPPVAAPAVAKPAAVKQPALVPVPDDDDPFGPPIAAPVAKLAPTSVEDDDPFGPPTTAATPQRPIRRFQTVPDHDDNPFD